MTLPVTITGISAAVAPVGPFKVAAGTSFNAVADITTATTTNSFLMTTGPSVHGGTFTAGSSFSLTQIGIYASASVGTANWASSYCEIRATNSTGTLLATSGGPSITSHTPGAGTVEQVFTFASPPALTSGVVYCYVIYTPSMGSAVGNLRGNATDTYAGGAAYVSASGTTSSVLTTARSSAPYDFAVNLYQAATIATDAYYFFGRDGTTATTLQAFKSAAPDTSWASVATKTGYTTALLNIAAYQVGKNIHIVTQDGTMATSVATKYVSFDAYSDTFLASTETIVAASNIAGQATSGWGCSVVARSTGEVVAFYNNTATNTSGTPRSRLHYRRRTALNTYVTSVQVDPNTATESTSPIVALGASDRLHLLFFNGTNTMQRHLTSANVLGTAASTGATALPQDVDTRDDSGTIRFVGLTAASAFRWSSADNPTVTNAAVTLGTPVRATDENAIIYALYQNNADSDLYVKSSSDNGATWGSAVLAFTGTVTAAAASLSKNQLIYQRGSDVVIPYIVNDGGTLKYNEYVVRSLVTNKTLTADGGAYLLTGAATTAVLLKRTIDATTGGSYALTGNDAALFKLANKRVSAEADSYALTGAATTSLLHAWKLPALAGSYALTGSDAAVTKGTALVNKTLPADGSSYSLTGSDAALIKRVNKVLAAEAGAYLLTGAATTAVLHRWKIAAPGSSYSLTGSDAVVTKLANKRLTAEAGAYALSGAAATIRPAKTIAATAGSYALSGAATSSVLLKRRLTAAASSYALSGADVAFQIRSEKFLSAATGSYSLSGSAANVLHRYKPAALAGSYSLTGADAALIKRVHRTLAAVGGSYALTGSAAAVLRGRKTAALGGSYSLTGSPATIKYGYRVTAGGGAYALTGNTANFAKTEVIQAGSGAYALTGTPALVKYSWTLRTDAGSYALSGSPTTLRRTKTLQAAAGAYALSGASAIITQVRLLYLEAAPGSYTLIGHVARLFTGEPVLSNRTVVVKAEDRIAETLAELRSVAALADNRTIAALAESRGISALTESRSIKVQGESHGVPEMV